MFNGLVDILSFIRQDSSEHNFLSSIADLDFVGQVYVWNVIFLFYLVKSYIAVDLLFVLLTDLTYHIHLPNNSTVRKNFFADLFINI